MASTEVEKVAAFLDKVKPIREDVHAKEEEKRARDENFNLFSILGIETREVYICKMLGALLSPQGGHDAGAIFLEKFLTDVLAESALAKRAEEAVVRCEDATKEGRRIDLTIEMNGKSIPIEAKIDAGDQEHQLADYYWEIASRAGKCDYVCYLTKDGRKPSLNSMTSTLGNGCAEGAPQANLNEAQIKRLSWKDDIVSWLEACASLEIVQRKTLVQKNIWQLIDTIRGWDNTMESQLMDFVKSDDDMDTAFYIWQRVSAARNALWKRFVKEFESQMKGVHPLERISDEDKDDVADYWFKKPERGNYGIGLALKSGSGENHCIGFCLFDSKGEFKPSEPYKSMLSGSMKAEVERLQERLSVKNGEKESEGSWLYREKFPEFKGKKINFFLFTKETAKLLLEEKLKEYVAAFFVCRIKKLTGWKDPSLTETNEKRENHV